MPLGNSEDLVITHSGCLESALNLIYIFWTILPAFFEVILDTKSQIRSDRAPVSLLVRKGNHVIESISHGEDHVEVTIGEDAICLDEAQVAKEQSLRVNGAQDSIGDIEREILRHLEAIQVEVHRIVSNTLELVGDQVVPCC